MNAQNTCFACSAEDSKSFFSRKAKCVEDGNVHDVERRNMLSARLGLSMISSKTLRWRHYATPVGSPDTCPRSL